MNTSAQVAADSARHLEAVQNHGAITPALSGLLQNYVELFKIRVTALVVMTAGAGFYLGSVKSASPVLSWALWHALLGVGIVSAGAAAMNQVLEMDSDACMLRTRMRPLPSERMSMPHAAVVGMLAVGFGAAYLVMTTNLLTGLLSLLTAISYIAIYTPLKRLTANSTFVGAFPGAMPPLLGWTAARGTLELEALVLFAILFFWQFPHFHSIAWLYREDYERAGIKMLAVVAPHGKSTVREVLIYAAWLIPVSIAPLWLHIAGHLYLFAAIILDGFLFYYAVRFRNLLRDPASGQSKKYARELLRASVIYLPLLFIALMLDAPRHG